MTVSLTELATITDLREQAQTPPGPSPSELPNMPHLRSPLEPRRLFFFFYFPPQWPRPGHTEVPRPGIESEPAMTYARSFNQLYLGPGIACTTLQLFKPQQVDS